MSKNIAYGIFFIANYYGRISGKKNKSNFDPPKGRNPVIDNSVSILKNALLQK